MFYNYILIAFRSSGYNSCVISMHGFFIIQDKMVSAETVGGKLKEAATKKADESILSQIVDNDLALKVKYHKQCYEKYMCKRFPQLVFHRPRL